MPTSLRAVLDREIALHRDLLAAARMRHMLLRQGRVAVLPALDRREAAAVAALRVLEGERARLARDRDARRANEVAAAGRRIGGLVRRIGAVERANRILVERRALRLRPAVDGVAVIHLKAHSGQADRLSR